MKMTATIPSSTAAIVADPAAFLEAVREGKAVSVPDFDYRAAVALTEALAEEELLAEMVSYRKDVTGVGNTIFISPKGNTRHAARVKVAINPPDSIDPRSETASVAIDDGIVKEGQVPAALLAAVQRFIALNRAALLDYWDYRIDTEELRRRLTSI
jgi:hypothetical protein